jgi:hypothetical protein
VFAATVLSRRTHAGRIDLDPPDQFTRLPIPEEDIPAPPRSKQSTAMDPFDGDSRRTALDQTGPLLEVSVDSNLVLGFLHGIGVGIASPSERSTGPEGLVSPSKRSVDDIFSITDGGDEPSIISIDRQLLLSRIVWSTSYEPSVRAMLKTLRQHVGSSELPRLNSQPLTVGNVVIGDRLQVGSQDRRVHRHRRLFSPELQRTEQSANESQLLSEPTLTDLEYDKPLIVTEGDLVSVLPVRNTPASLQPVAQGRLQPVGRRVPELDGPVFGTRNDERQRRMEDGKRDVGSGRIDGLHARLVLVVPNLDGPIRANRRYDKMISQTTPSRLRPAATARLTSHRHTRSRKAYLLRGSNPRCSLPFDGHPPR